MFDISFAELIIIILIGLIFVAPKNLPILARVGGKVFQQAKNFLAEIKEELERESHFKELKKIEREIKKRSNKS